jgi:hypothetical protein
MAINRYPLNQYDLDRLSVLRRLIGTFEADLTNAEIIPEKLERVYDLTKEVMEGLIESKVNRHARYERGEMMTPVVEEKSI